MKSYQEAQKNQQNCTLSASVLVQTIYHNDKSYFCTKTRKETGLKWV